MRVGILGAGLQGEACCKILDRDNDVDKICLGDINSKRLSIVAKQVSCKTVIKKVDANNQKELIAFLKECDVCIDLLLPEFTVNVMKACLEVGINYINTAFDNPFWINLVNKEQLFLDKEFKEKGLTALLGCGDSPGLVNIFIKKYADKLDVVNSIKIKGAYYDEDEFNPLNKWNPGWSLRQAYIDFITPPIIFRNCEYKKMSPFSECERIDFYDYGIRDIVLHSHEEAYSLPRTIKGLKNCEFKYEIDKYAAMLYSFGFDLEKIIEIDNKDIKVLDVLFSLIKDLDLNKQNIDSVDKKCEYTSYIEIEGIKDEKCVTYKVLLKPLYLNKKGVMEKFGTLKIDVALPCCVGMRCLDDSKKGVIFAEELDYEKFINILNSYVDYKEIVL